MQSAARIIISVFLLSSALASANHNTAKLRRDGVLNLYPFPRVGRSSHRTWQLPNDLPLYLDYEPVDKRQLYAFPRVGRSNPGMSQLSQMSQFHMEPLRYESQFQPIPVRRTDSPGMWFGPRLGRSFKSEEDDIVIHNESEPEQMQELDNEERKKRQIKN